MIRALSEFIVKYFVQDILAAFGIKTAVKKTTFQLSALQNHFVLNRYPSKEERKKLGLEIGMSANQVKWWFEKERKKIQ